MDKIELKNKIKREERDFVTSQVETSFFERSANKSRIMNDKFNTSYKINRNSKVSEVYDIKMA